MKEMQKIEELMVETRPLRVVVFVRLLGNEFHSHIENFINNPEYLKVLSDPYGVAFATKLP